MPALNSTCLSWAEYDPSTGEMDLTFCSGKPYTFYRVPAYIYDELVNATSPGGYYHSFISGRYKP